MSGNVRVRWAAIGAAVAVVFGAGGFGVVNATISSGSKSTFVPIRACRLLDTRPSPRTIGTRGGVLTAGETASFLARGINGQCKIPTGATSIVAQVTAYGPTATGGIIVFTAGEPKTSTVNLVFSAHEAQVGSLATVKLSSSGKFSIYNSVGSVNVSVDIQGYYEDHNHDDRYYTKAQVDAAVRTAIAAARPGVVTVAKSGGDFSNVQAAINSIVDASATKPYVVRIGPGVFSGAVTLKDNVDLEGAGPDHTTLTTFGANGLNLPGSTPTVAATGPIHAEVRDLSIEQVLSPAESTGAVAVYDVGTTEHLRYRNVHISATSNYEAIGVAETDSATRFDDVVITADALRPNGTVLPVPFQFAVWAVSSSATFSNSTIETTPNPDASDSAIGAGSSALTIRSSKVIGGMISSGSTAVIGSELSGGASGVVCVGVYDPVAKADISGQCI